MDLCSVCGKNLALVGLRHLCRPRAPVITTKPAEPLITTKVITTKVITKPEKITTKGKGKGWRREGLLPMTGYERLKRYRARRRVPR
jgi:hypothetical protein